MVVLLAVSSPSYFPNGKAGIMDSDLLDLEPISIHNWAAYAVAVIEASDNFSKAVGGRMLATRPPALFGVYPDQSSREGNRSRATISLIR